ncbi:MAG TPA: chorismate synthase [Nitrospiria bacterium]|nr:chorismate synthase [Nitrospiria bacterium]
MLRCLNSGESHGQMLAAILEGMPAGVPVTEEAVNHDLVRRQRGYGRGGRMKIEQDRVEFISGVRKGLTMGSPIGLLVRNKDWENWKEIMSVAPGEPSTERVVTRPRPGHADFAGAVKYNHTDIRNVLEKASARETAIRVAIGAVAKQLLAQFGMTVVSYTVEIGGVVAATGGRAPEELYDAAERSEVRCADSTAEARMIDKIKEAKEKGDTLGGVFEVVVTHPPVGLGSYAQWDRRLNARLAFALMSIQAMKGVEIGLGFETARRFGSQVHDEIFYGEEAAETTGGRSQGKFYRKTNNAGGFEGGITNGQDIVLRVAMKPISTLYKPLQSVDMKSKEPFQAAIERSDICTVPAAGVVGEAVVAFEMAGAMIDKFGGDSLREMKRNYDGYMRTVEEL